MPASVLVVDDSAIYRSVISRCITSSEGLQVAGQAGDGHAAVRAIKDLRPDLVTLDLEMPGLDGIGVLKALREQPAGAHRPLIILFSAHTRQGAETTLECLRLGATDFLLKPTSSDGLAAITDRLVPRLQGLARSIALPPRAPPRIGAGAPASAPVRTRAGVNRLLVIASSTGGPQALQAALPALPSPFPVPILVVQHMPPLFTAVMSEHLAKLCRNRVGEAVDGEVLQPGRIYVAPGDYHMAIARQDRQVVVRLNQGERFCGLRPAAEALLPSVAEVFGGQVVTAVFTGMGNDGAAGCKILKNAGACILTQTQESCVVYGMPQAVDQLGISDGHFTPDTFAASLAGYTFAW